MYLQYIGEVLSSQSLYRQSFANLVYEIFESKNWRIKDLEEATGYCRQTISNYLNNHFEQRDVIIRICIALGLDLVMTTIFLISKGYILNPSSSSDKQLMKFLDTNHADGLCRVLDYDDFIKS